MTENFNIKKLLLNKCQEFVKNKLIIAQQELHSAQEAADSEQSNSSTDNYNTDKAMIQIEIEKYEGQLIEAQKLEKALKMINIDRNYEVVDLGSLVETNMGKYFLSIGLGKIIIDQDTIYAISPASPIGQQLQGKKEGDHFLFNNKKITIKSIC